MSTAGLHKLPKLTRNDGCAAAGAREAQRLPPQRVAGFALGGGRVRAVRVRWVVVAVVAAVAGAAVTALVLLELGRQFVFHCRFGTAFGFVVAFLCRFLGARRSGGRRAAARGRGAGSIRFVVALVVTAVSAVIGFGLIFVDPAADSAGEDDVHFVRRIALPEHRLVFAHRLICHLLTQPSEFAPPIALFGDHFVERFAVRHTTQRTAQHTATHPHRSLSADARARKRSSGSSQWCRALTR